MIFTRLLDKILIFTNPLTYLGLLGVIIYLPFNWICRKLQLHNLWFIFFQINKHNKDGLNRVIQASKRNYKLCNNRWYRYVFALSIVKCRNHIKSN